MEIKETVKLIGDNISLASAWILQQLQDSGILISDITSKIITALVLSVIAWIVIKFVNVLSKPVKWIIVILLFLLTASVIYSLIG